MREAKECKAGEGNLREAEGLLLPLLSQLGSDEMHYIVERRSRRCGRPHTKNNKGREGHSSGSSQGRVATLCAELPPSNRLLVATQSKRISPRSHLMSLSSNLSVCQSAEDCSSAEPPSSPSTWSSAPLPGEAGSAPRYHATAEGGGAAVGCSMVKGQARVAACGWEALLGKGMY